MKTVMAYMVLPVLAPGLVALAAGSGWAFADEGAGPASPAAGWTRTAATPLSPATGAPPAAPAYAADIEEWEVPWENSGPRHPSVDREGRVWFVGQRADYLAYLTPVDGTFQRFDLEAGTSPHSVIIDDRGHAWYAGNRAAHIGRLDPASGEISLYPMPDVAARDPHTLRFDGRGHIWFTLQGSNMVGRLTMASGEIDLVRIETESARPYGLAVDSTGRPWFSLLGAPFIGTIDPVTLELQEHALPRSGARTRRIEIDSEDRIWYVDWAQGHLGRFDPATASFREWVAPHGAGALPYGMTMDDRERVWFVESGPSPNQLVGFDPDTERFFSSDPVEAGTVRHLTFHRPTREIWFGTDTNMIARARIYSSAGG